MILTTSDTGIIALDGVSKVFDETQVLDGIALNVAKSERIALIGPSGCGKTTLLRLIAGLETATAGRVSLSERSPLEATREHLIGLAFQKAALVPTRTALENVQLTLEITGDEGVFDPEKLLHDFGLEGFEDHFPHQLSGGMQQRVNIAASLVHDPRYLLLDEPLGALDEMTRHGMILWLEGVLEKTRPTVVLVTHSIEEAVLLCDRVIVLHPRPGRIAADIEVGLPRPRADVSDAARQGVAERIRAALAEVTEGGKAS